MGGWWEDGGREGEEERRQKGGDKRERETEDLERRDDRKKKCWKGGARKMEEMEGGTAEGVEGSLRAPHQKLSLFTNFSFPRILEVVSVSASAAEVPHAEYSISPSDSC